MLARISLGGSSKHTPSSLPAHEPAREAVGGGGGGGVGSQPGGVRSYMGLLGFRGRRGAGGGRLDRGVGDVSLACCGMVSVQSDHSDACALEGFDGRAMGFFSALPIPSVMLSMAAPTSFNLLSGDVRRISVLLIDDRAAGAGLKNRPGEGDAWFPRREVVLWPLEWWLGVDAARMGPCAVLPGGNDPTSLPNPPRSPKSSSRSPRAEGKRGREV